MATLDTRGELALKSWLRDHPFVASVLVGIIATFAMAIPNMTSIPWSPDPWFVVGVGLAFGVMTRLAFVALSRRQPREIQQR
jgi:protein-S-isoprenylcysteine O-methyltransferase Ste14